MELSSADRELLWLDLQSATKVQAAIAHRIWRNQFILAVVLIVLALGIATAFSRLAGDVAIPLVRSSVRV